MNERTYLGKVRWWFLRLLKAWSEVPNWWVSYGYAWKDAAYSLLEIVVLLLAPALSVTAPVWALIQHINDKRNGG